MFQLHDFKTFERVNLNPYTVFGYTNGKERKMMKEVERKRKGKDSRFLLVFWDDGRKGKKKSFYFYFFI